MHIVVDPRRLGKVQLIPIGMRVRARSVTSLRASRDGEGAAAGALQVHGAVDGVGSETLVGGAGWVAGGGAATGGGGADAGRGERCCGRGLGDGEGGGGEGEDGGGDG